jgi:hypothetical protein
MTSHALVIVELEVKEHERLKPLARAVFMSTILYLPTSTKSRTQNLLQESEAKETGICCSQTERIAHDLKNCMSVLLLAITSLKDNVDQPLISLSRRRVLEDVVGEMNRLVDEMVRLVESQGNK